MHKGNRQINLSEPLPRIVNMAYAASIVHYLSLHPRRLFLLDGMGALLTAATLYGSYRFFSNCFQLPEDVFSLLFFAALYMAVFSFINVANPRNYAVFSLRFIAVANSAYAILTLGIVLVSFRELSRIGILYFSFEMPILFFLSYVEFRVAGIVKQQHAENPAPKP